MSDICTPPPLDARRDPDRIYEGDRVSWLYHGTREFGRVTRVHGKARVYMVTSAVHGLMAVPASSITKEDK